jgi:hypothetical protein
MRATFFAVSLVFLGVPAMAPAEEPVKEQTVVTVDLGKTVVESFMGLGIQWDPYEYAPTPEDWKLTL